MTFGQKIQVLRKQNNMSQEELAEKIGVTRQTVSKWELGQSTPDLSYIVQLSDIFTVTTDYLIKLHTDEFDENENMNLNSEITQEKRLYTERKEQVKSRGISAHKIVGIVMSVLGCVLMIVGLIIISMELESELFFVTSIPLLIAGTLLLVIKNSPVFKAMWIMWLFIFLSQGLILSFPLPNLLVLILHGTFTIAEVFSAILYIWFIIMLVYSLKRLKRKKSLEPNLGK